MTELEALAAGLGARLARVRPQVREHEHDVEVSMHVRRLERALQIAYLGWQRATFDARAARAVRGVIIEASEHCAWLEDRFACQA